MDNKQLQQFMLPIGILFILIVVIGLFLPKVFGNLNNYRIVNNDIKMKTEQLKQKQEQLDQLNASAAEIAQKENDASNADKPFYKPIMAGFDSEAAIAGEFSEILQLVRANQIKIRSIKYEYDKDVTDDAFAQNASDQYNVARLNIEMIANYSNYDNFLKEMYKHDHFLDIQQIEIVPYKKNKKVLLINCKVKLYAKK